MLVGFTILVLALILSGRGASLSPQELDGLSLSQQTKSPPQITDHKATTILAVAQ